MPYNTSPALINHFAYIGANTNASAQMIEDMLRDQLMLTRLGYGLSSKRVNLICETSDSKAGLKTFSEFLSAKGFVFAAIDGYTVGIAREGDLPYVRACVELNSTSYSFRGSVVGEDAFIDEIKAYFDEHFPLKGSLVQTVCYIREQRLQMESNHVSPNTGNVAKQVFYPFMKTALDEYYDKFMASNENVLVLYGPPGTGKSTFLRSLIANKTENAWLTYNRSVIESDLLINDFYANGATLLALEDIDKYMGARTDGNSVMSSFLNASEGIIERKKKKIVFSTNLPTIDKIDAALLRRGRCFDVIKFELLSVPEARAVEAEMGLPEQDLSSKTRWALSEILNPLTADLQSSERGVKTIGFN